MRSRFERLLSYTTIRPAVNRLHLISARQSQAQSLLTHLRFDPTTSESGITFLDLAYDSQPKTGVLSGEHVGQIVSLQFRNRQALLYQYDMTKGCNSEPTYLFGPKITGNET